MFTKFSPGTQSQIRQIHNRAAAVEGKVYYALDDNNLLKSYRGTHEGRLKNETDIISNEEDISDNNDRLDDIDESILDLIKEDERLDDVKADKCFAIAMSIIL